MRRHILALLVCPACGGALEAPGADDDEEMTSGELACTGCSSRYAIRGGVPRFVGGENYAKSFGLQWNRFRRTQLDGATGLPISRRRFLDETGWTESELAGRRVLDVGCGAGRFAEIALSLGAEVFAVDYSDAVDACWQNLSKSPGLHVIQADVYSLPFRPAQFDFVYSLGVLQHTPDVKQALMALTRPLRSGGKLAVDIYLLRLSTLLHPRYALRPFTKRIDPERLFGLVERCVPPLLGISRAVSSVPLLGRLLRRLVPVANYEGTYGLSKAQLLDWAVLDTFDWLAPKYDQPQTAATLRSWLIEAGLTDVDVFISHHLVGRGWKNGTPGAVA